MYNILSSHCREQNKSSAPINECKKSQHPYGKWKENCVSKKIYDCYAKYCANVK